MHGFLLASKLIPLELKALYAKSNGHPSKSENPLKPSNPTKVFEIYLKPRKLRSFINEKRASGTIHRLLVFLQRTFLIKKQNQKLVHLNNWRFLKSLNN